MLEDYNEPLQRENSYFQQAFLQSWVLILKIPIVKLAQLL